MQLFKNSLQLNKKRRRQALSSFNRLPPNELHGKGETIQSLDRLRDSVDSLQPGVYLPFLVNEPKPQGPSGEKCFLPDILEHQEAPIRFHPPQVGFNAP